MATAYCPCQGDVVWLSFDPQTGRKQAGHCPGLVLSPERYNRKVGSALLCPITPQGKGYPFEVAVPSGLEVLGVILSDQVKSLGWKARKTLFGCRLPSETFQEVVAKLATLLEA